MFCECRIARSQSFRYQLNFSFFSVSRFKQQDILGKHYDVQRKRTDKTTPSYSKTVQLYSKSSGKFVQVMKRAVNASGSEYSDAGELI